MPRIGPATRRIRLRSSAAMLIAVKNHASTQASILVSPEAAWNCGSASPQHALPGMARGGAEQLLDADELVVLGEPVGARERAGLDLPAIGGDGEVGDGRVLGLARAVR